MLLYANIVFKLIFLSAVIGQKDLFWPMKSQNTEVLTIVKVFQFTPPTNSI